MSLTVKKGQVSALDQSTRTVGRNGNINSIQSYVFRIGTTAASLQMTSSVSLHDGDAITAVGETKKGTFKIHAFRNETTGAYSEPSALVTAIYGICLVVLGAITFVFLIGMVLLPIGIYFLYKSWKAHKAKRMLRNASFR